MIHLERNCKVKIKVGHLETRTRPQGPGAQKILPPKRETWEQLRELKVVD